MSVEPKVCAAVVTYNRKDLLRGCLKSLLAQTRLPDQIVVVDNHSNDGTVEMLRAEFETLAGIPPFTIVALPENNGGAAGFAAGLDWGHKRGFDWIWVMDDDIEILPGALELMLPYGNVSDFIQCRRHTPGSDVILECLFDLTACSAFNPRMPIIDLDAEKDRPWIAVQWGNFEGPLIHRSVVDRIGLPDARFFVGGDDSIYGLEASFRTNIIYLREFGIDRKLAKPKRATKMGFYLLLRNRFLTREHLEKLGFTTNTLLFWCSQLIGLLAAIRQVLGDAGQTKKREMIGAVFSGLVDGAKGRFGRPPFIKA